MQGVGKGVLDGNSPRDLPGQNHIIPLCSRDYHESITIQRGQGMAYHRRTACCTCLHENDGLSGIPTQSSTHYGACERNLLGHTTGLTVNFRPKELVKTGVKRFVEKHSDKIKAFWSHPLDHSRARAVNPYTKEEFFKLLEAVIEGDGGDDIIPPELIYGTDETGIQQGIGVKERVYGPQGAKIQHQQRSGDRENITVITTICADGTWVAPAVIFKGEGYQTSWKQNNPLKMS